MFSGGKEVYLDSLADAFRNTKDHSVFYNEAHRASLSGLDFHVMEKIMLKKIP